MPVQQIALGPTEEFTQISKLKLAISEFIATFIFIFAGKGSIMAFGKLTNSGYQSPEGVIVASLGYGLGLVSAMSASVNISGGHANPAVTFGVFIGGNITFFRSILYSIAQIAGSTCACLLLKLCTGGMLTSPPALGDGVMVSSGVVFEIVLTFGLVYTFYATVVDPKSNGNLVTLAPLAVGLMMAANILVGGAFSGACMNPAGSFGAALVSWDWTNHWVYWVGPLIGAGFAGLIYDCLYICDHYQQIPVTTEN